MTFPDRQQPVGAKEAAIRDFAEQAEYGQRAKLGVEGLLVGFVALCWSLFQLWFSSPLPYVFNVGIFNDSQARLIHLAFALFLAFAIAPATKRAIDRIPFYDWLIGFGAVAVCLYGLVFYDDLVRRAGQPISLDLLIAGLGILLVLEATRRSMGPFLVAVAVIFLLYSYFGRAMPEVLQHRGASVTRILEHQWLDTQGIFGVPLGASTAFVFVYVLFGTMFNKAGAGHYIMQLSLAFLGHLRGGPAKVAVVSSGLNGLISGSALANVVASGIFTIPLMKRTGMSGIKAGAVETSASINGQIMPPVMGAAAFIMVEYVGIPYADVVRHAFLPAAISYVSLFYIVHLEALKLDIEPMCHQQIRPAKALLLRYGLGISGSLMVLGSIYYLVLGIQLGFGSLAPLVLAAVIGALYLTALSVSARHPDLPPENPDGALAALPQGWEVARSGLHLLIPVIVLVWCLIVIRLSPGLAAFWATVSVMAILVTQEPLKRLLRRERGLAAAFANGCRAVVEGLVLGARNMVGVALATATAGIVVGTVTLTGLGLMMTDAVGLLSGGNIYLVLIFTALVTLILGCGVPTTANYILVASLMAPVIVELGSEAGVAIPLIGVHLFVFYFGIMADSTPPVGLGAYAAAAISGESPIRTAVQASVYGLRTAILAFVLVFNPELLLIGIQSLWHGLAVAVASIAGCLMFAAATLNYWMVRNRWWETVVLLFVSVALIYPAGWLDLLYEKYDALPPSALMREAEAAPADARLVVRFQGTSIEGETVSRLASLRLGPKADGAARLAHSGLHVSTGAEQVRVTQVRFASYAARLRLESGYRITAVYRAAQRPSPGFVYIIALVLLAGVAFSQVQRLQPERRPFPFRRKPEPDPAEESP
ncbi:TRAP transporter permease [Pelagibius litoralis]|uniref:TRAP transporter permease n=1 Tax=Pelagibius litoralis TaxID=374515 RepID=A0A967KF72_9PROT|nr:TRAP transporter permease [Pelagibius litoralis]NIA72269.1 TRAP transporter permease [Pelagibius litoralis]